MKIFLMKGWIVVYLASGQNWIINIFNIFNIVDKK